MIPTPTQTEPDYASNQRKNATRLLAGALGLAKNLVNGTVAFAAWMVLTAYFIHS